MKKIELHEVNADLVQARESAVAVKALQDEIENELGMKPFNDDEFYSLIDKINGAADRQFVTLIRRSI